MEYMVTDGDLTLGGEHTWELQMSQQEDVHLKLYNVTNQKLPPYI